MYLPTSNYKANNSALVPYTKAGATTAKRSGGGKIKGLKKFPKTPKNTASVDVWLRFNERVTEIGLHNQQVRDQHNAQVALKAEIKSNATGVKSGRIRLSEPKRRK